MSQSLHSLAFELKSFFDPWKSIVAVNAELGNVSSDTIKDIKRLAREYSLNSDHLVLMLLLARHRTKIKYSDNEAEQAQINRLFDLKEKFVRPSLTENAPIKKITIELEGNTIEISNHTLMWNFYSQIHPSLNSFLSDFVKKRFKKLTKKQGLSGGLTRSNKNLAKNMFKYLKHVSPGIKQNKMGEIVIELFDLADNPLPYETGKRCYQQLGTEK